MVSTHLEEHSVWNSYDAVVVIFGHVIHSANVFEGLDVVLLHLREHGVELRVRHVSIAKHPVSTSTAAFDKISLHLMVAHCIDD